MSTKQLFLSCLLTFLVEQCFCQDTPSTIANTVSTTLIPTIASTNTESPLTPKMFDHTFATTTTATTEQAFCNSKYDCYNNGDYSKICYNGKCKCELGYNINVMGLCSKIECIRDSDCYEVQENTVCTDRTCVCQPNYYLEKSSQLCRPQSGEKNLCDSDYDCEYTLLGFNSHCFERKCDCNLGYRLLKGRCTKEACYSDYDCSQRNTKCSERDCICADDYYYHNTATQTCERIKSCSYDSDCKLQIGPFSVCYSSTCKCELGYRLVAGKCTQTSCSGNWECIARDSNTQCKYGNCVCDSSSYLNSNSQTCTTFRMDPSVDPFDNLSILLPVLLVVLLIFVILIAVYRVKRRIAQRSRRQTSNFPLIGSSSVFSNRTPPPPYSPTNPNPTIPDTTEIPPEQICPEDPPPPYCEVSVSNEIPPRAHPSISLHV